MLVVLFRGRKSSFGTSDGVQSQRSTAELSFAVLFTEGILSRKRHDRIEILFCLRIGTSH